MAQLIAFAALAVSLAGLIAVTLERRAPGRLPILTLVADRFGSRPPRARLSLLACLAGLGTGLGGSLVALLLGRAGISIAADDGPIAAWVVASVGLALVWAAAEELIYRGALLHWVARATSPVTGLLVSSIVFAAAHIERGGAPADWLALPVRTLHGVSYGLAYAATGTLWAPTLWHAAHNLCVWLFVGGGRVDLPSITRIHITGPDMFVGQGGAGWVDVLVSAAFVGLALAALWGSGGRLRRLARP